MNKSFSIFAVMVALTATASAQQAAESIQTSGSGELRRQSDLMLNPGGGNTPIRLPATVSRGDVISIQYQTAGGMFSDSFIVTGITISGDRCSLESKHHSADGMELVDMVFTQPCSRLK